MRKITELKNKLILTGGYLILLGILWYFKVPCLFVHFFDIECIGCGMSRAMISVLKFDFVDAFHYHPMFWSMPILYVYFLFDGKVLGKKILDVLIIVFIFLGFVLNWVIKLL